MAVAVAVPLALVLAPTLWLRLLGWLAGRAQEEIPPLLLPLALLLPLVLPLVLALVLVPTLLLLLLLLLLLRD